MQVPCLSHPGEKAVTRALRVGVSHLVSKVSGDWSQLGEGKDSGPPPGRLSWLHPSAVPGHTAEVGARVGGRLVVKGAVIPEAWVGICSLLQGEDKGSPCLLSAPRWPIPIGYSLHTRQPGA